MQVKFPLPSFNKTSPKLPSSLCNCGMKLNSLPAVTRSVNPSLFISIQSTAFTQENCISPGNDLTEKFPLPLLIATHELEKLNSFTIDFENISEGNNSCTGFFA